MRLCQSCQAVHIEAPETFQSFLLQVLTGKAVLETSSFNMIREWQSHQGGHA